MKKAIVVPGLALALALAALAVGTMSAAPQSPSPGPPAPEPRAPGTAARVAWSHGGLRVKSDESHTGRDALDSMARADAGHANNGTVHLFRPRLEFPDVAMVDAEGLIPIRVIAKVANKGADRAVYWKVQSTRITQAGRETVWAGSYEHLKFTIGKDTDEDRVFTERLQMPPGHYYVLVSLCDDGIKPDPETGEPVEGRPIVSGGFHVTVP